ncbi:ornithine cyclodeaminase family protein [Risungbinella massiliensis]|uniref:ornithine cyclodeaminase family protein n=1 Tax=Risungbinella massiliensis TaxID=1329796 RepID=UPI0005CC2AC5|nr:ornithine cyclodeaminase family protein [Risungbinella massiliensis]
MSKKIDCTTRILTNTDVSKILTFDLVIKAVEEAFKLYSMNKVQLAPVVSLEIKNADGEVDIKSGYDQENELIGTKIASGYWHNPKNYSLPSSLATIVLQSGQNGVPLAIIEASAITNMRTGAAGAISAKYLARSDSKKIAVLGTGTQAMMQILALEEIFDMEVVKVWGRNPERASEYINTMKLKSTATFMKSETPKSCIEDADIIITTTGSKVPLIQKDWVRAGTHIICIGADMEGKQEIDEQLFEDTKVVVDSLAQCSKRGELQHAIQKQVIVDIDVYAELGEIILGNKVGRESLSEITIFDATGLSIQDISVAKEVLKSAYKQNIGFCLPFI